MLCSTLLCSALLCLRRPRWRHCPAATGGLHNKDGNERLSGSVSALCLAFQRAREAVTAVTAITFRRRTASCAMSGCAQVSQARSNHKIVEGFPYVNHKSIATATEQHMHHAPARDAPGLQACKPAKQPFPVACGHCVSISLAVAAAITSHSPSPRNTHKMPTSVTCGPRQTMSDQAQLLRDANLV